MIDEEGHFLYVNNMAQHFWEYTEAELRQKKWQDITHPEDLSADVSMHKMLKDKKQQQYTMCKRYITKSGRVVWGSLTVHMLNDTGSNYLYFLSQVVPLDNYIHGSGEVTAPVSTPAPKDDEEGKQSKWGEYIKKNFPSFLSLLFVVVGGVYIFSSDFGANKQKVKNLEDSIKKIEAKVDESNKESQKKWQEMMNILRDIKNKSGAKK